MSNRIGNSCRCQDAYSPAQSSERGRELQAARQANRLARQQPAARFDGAAAGYRSKESADLVVKTADGDTVRISIDALTRAQAGVYSASVGGAAAGEQTFIGESSYAVKVSVKGSLDEKEAQQIGDLLQKLVSASRSGAPPAENSGSSDTLSSFRYAYRAYSESSQTTLSAQSA